MNPDNTTDSGLTSKTFMDLIVRIGFVAALVIFCVRVLSPFIPILAWGLILAIMLYPMHQGFAKRLGGRQGTAATLLVLVGFLLLVLPLGLLGRSFVSHIQDVRVAVENNQFSIKQPGPGVADWPIIGKKVDKAWSEAATNMPMFFEDYREQIKKISKGAVSATANAFGSVFLLLGALIIAGIMMAWGESGSKAAKRILCRIAGPIKGPRIQSLSVGTVRSVATGVLGVAFVQALFFGIGFILAGIPAAGVLALIVMLVGIIQLPAAIVALPVIIYLWSAGGGSSTANVVYTIWFMLAGLSDNVLKPLLLGRGVDAPMPVILIGALGGMVVGGFIGLFLGAVLLAISYQLFMSWVDEGEVLGSAGSNQEDLAKEVTASGN